MKKLLFYIFCFVIQIYLSLNIFGHPPTAYGEIQGKVTDADTGEALPFANVSIEIAGKTMGTTTDFDGIYSLSPIPSGRYEVTFAFVGCDTKKITEVEVNIDKTTFLNASLTSNSELLDAVEVVEYKIPLLDHSSTKRKKRQRRRKNKVTSQQIESMPTRNVKSIAGQAAGVSQSDGGETIIRGSQSSGTDYYIDGIKVKGTSPLPANSIEQLSTVTGGVPARYENAGKYKAAQNTSSKSTLPKATKEEIFMHHDTSQEIDKPSNPYKDISIEYPMLSVAKAPLSTFSIDVDRASYSQLRSTLNYGSMPHPDNVRIEELINYFDYEYRPTQGKAPFSITTELSDCPWNPKHQLALVALQGRKITLEQTPPQNLVFLLDVSGSMSSSNKLPLLKNAFRLLVGQLRPKDKVAIVVYAGAAGMVLPSTSGSEKSKILNALSQLNAGGSTAGGAGIELAYQLAQKSFEEGGNNRVILATDGDFNVGVSSNGELTKLIEQKRKTGIFLTVLGFGMGNYQDEKMEELSNHGNGNYAYIDNQKEARKVLIKELGGTLHTIAKDVKLQVEFNPKEVQGYRLIGYVNRRLADEDFNDDTKDAGEMGAGHSVTALYEIVPSNVSFDDQSSNIDALKYQNQKASKTNATANKGEILTVKVRYKEPTADISTKTEHILAATDYTPIETASNNFQWASTVTTFGIKLQNTPLEKDISYEALLEVAQKAKDKDSFGYRQEMIDLIQKVKELEERFNTSSEQ